LDIIILDAVDILHGENPAGCHLTIYFRDVNSEIVDELACKTLHMGGLQRIIKLLFQCAGKFFHNPARTVDIPAFKMSFHKGGQVEHDLHVHLDVLADVRPLDLDNHIVLIGEPGPVYLSQGGRGERGLIEGLKNLDLCG